MTILHFWVTVATLLDLVSLTCQWLDLCRFAHTLRAAVPPWPVGHVPVTLGALDWHVCHWQGVQRMAAATAACSPLRNPYSPSDLSASTGPSPLGLASAACQCRARLAVNISLVSHVASLAHKARSALLGRVLCPPSVGAITNRLLGLAPSACQRLDALSTTTGLASLGLAFSACQCRARLAVRTPALPAHVAP
jgi:hypothetical protein